MRLTIIGSGDAFGSGGRFNTCFFLETAKGKLLVDCGASSLVALKAQGLDPNEVDGIVLSHLHGDHFGALPFLLMDAQFLMRRERPLLIAGPPGTRTRLDQSLEVFFPRSSTIKWRFSWKVMEIEVARPTEVLGHCVSGGRWPPPTPGRLADRLRADCCPVASRDGHDFPGLVGECVPGVAAVVDDIVEGFENSVRQPVLPHHQLAAGALIRSPRRRAPAIYPARRGRGPSPS
jgi:metal-dependent hydrolase (beta-lactamase superfamily II)